MQMRFCAPESIETTEQGHWQIIIGGHMWTLYPNGNAKIERASVPAVEESQGISALMRRFPFKEQL